MAGSEKDVARSGPCKYGNNKEKTGLKCVKCSKVAHPSCAKRINNVKMCDGGMICCASENEIMCADVDVMTSITDDLSNIEQNPLKREMLFKQYY